MDRQKLIEQIKVKAPAILEIVVSEMGYEFSAISSNGFIECSVGMLLATETKGRLPDFLEDESISANDRKEKLEHFFEENLETIPYEELTDVQILTLAQEKIE